MTVDIEGTYSFRGSRLSRVVEYTEPDNDGYVVTKLDKETGTITLSMRHMRWTKFYGKYLAWRLWYRQEPGVHLTETHPDGAVERSTLPPSYLYEGH